MRWQSKERIKAAEVLDTWKNHTLFSFQTCALIKLSGVYRCVGPRNKIMLFGFFLSCLFYVTQQSSLVPRVTCKHIDVLPLGATLLMSWALSSLVCQGNILRAGGTGWICAFSWGLEPKSLSHSRQLGLLPLGWKQLLPVPACGSFRFPAGRPLALSS